MSESLSSIPPPPDHRRRLGWRLLAPLAAAVAVALVVGGVLLFRGGAGGRPPMLHLAGAGSVDEAAAGLAQGAAGALGAPRAPIDVGRGSGYRVEGTLPTGPARGRIYRLSGGQAPRQAVERLAAALGVSGTPVRAGDGWAAPGSGGVALRVSDGPGWRWMFGSGLEAGGSGGGYCHVIVEGRRACPPEAPVVPPQPVPPGRPGKVVPVQPPVVGPNGGVASDVSSGSSASGSAPAAAGSAGPGKAGSGNVGSGNVGSGSSGSGGTAVPVPIDPSAQRTPPEDQVRGAARPVLAALGLDDAPIRVSTFPGAGTVMASPLVGGLPTAGYDTQLSYDSRVRLTAAMGWLGTATPGAEYPLVSAKRALDAIPVPPALGIPCTDVEPSSCRPVQQVITGGRPGLLLTWEQDGAPLLVPAWLYDVKGWTVPLTAIAVDPAYLAPPVARKLPATAGSASAEVTVVAPAPPVTPTR